MLAVFSEAVNSNDAVRYLCACVDGPSGYHSHLLGGLSVAAQAGLGTEFWILLFGTLPLPCVWLGLAKTERCQFMCCRLCSANAINELKYVLQLCITK